MDTSNTLMNVLSLNNFKYLSIFTYIYIFDYFNSPFDFIYFFVCLFLTSIKKKKKEEKNIVLHIKSLYYLCFLYTFKLKIYILIIK